MKKRVLLGVSGGGDSSVTAVLLKNQGYEVLGAFLKLSEPLPPETDYWEKLAQKKRKESGAYKYMGSSSTSEDEAPKKAFFRTHCLQASDSVEAQKVCTRFDIPFYEIDCRDAFNFSVKDPFVHAMLNRRSIYPCGFCTRDLKIGMLLKKAEELGCEYIATGHYAQITQEVSTGQYYLRKSVDLTKDQTFELSGLDQKALSKLLTPLGGLSKGMVRKLAEEFDFQFRNREESQGCFLKSPELIPFLEQSTAPSLRPPGVVRTVEGDVVGEHDGLYQFQVGQTENLKLTMHDGKRKLQVVGFDPVSNVLVVGEKKDTQCTEVRLSDVNWLSPPHGLAAVRCKTKVQDLPGEIESEVFCFENSTAHVYFKEPKDDVASGMRLVFLEGDRVLGCGTVERVEKI